MRATYTYKEFPELLEIIQNELMRQREINRRGWIEYEKYLIEKYSHGFTLANLFKWSDAKIVARYDPYRWMVQTFTADSYRRSLDLSRLMGVLKTTMDTSATTITLNDNELCLIKL